MQSVKIYQLKKDKEYPYLFMNYYFANQHGFSLNDYELVYDTERYDDYNRSDAFYEFNMNRPEDFTGHSLSVSDIVEIDGYKYYCDDVGWREVK